MWSRTIGDRPQRKRKSPWRNRISMRRAVRWLAPVVIFRHVVFVFHNFLPSRILTFARTRSDLFLHSGVHSNVRSVRVRWHFLRAQFSFTTHSSTRSSFQCIINSGGSPYDIAVRTVINRFLKIRQNRWIKYLKPIGYYGQVYKHNHFFILDSAWCRTDRMNVTFTQTCTLLIQSTDRR